MKKGFTLIEMVIAVAISGIISTALYMLLHQTQRAVSNIITITTDDAVLITTYQQLLRDITGAFAPSESWPRRTSPQAQALEGKQTQNQKTPPDIKSPQKDTQVKLDEKQKTTEQPPDVTNVFVYTAKSGMFSNLTFISHNPLSVYSDPEQASSTIRAVRIMYSLKPDTFEPDSFVLMRQESSILDVKKFNDTNKIRAYELARGIKNFTLQFMYEPSSQEEQEDTDSSQQAEQEQATEKKIKRYRTVTSWSSDELVQKPGSALVPSYVRAKIDFIHSRNPLEILIPIEGPGLPGRNAPPTATPKPAPDNKVDATKEKVQQTSAASKPPITGLPQKSPHQAPRGGRR